MIALCRHWIRRGFWRGLRYCTHWQKTHHGGTETRRKANNKGANAGELARASKHAGGTKRRSNQPQHFLTATTDLNRYTKPSRCKTTQVTNCSPCLRASVVGVLLHCSPVDSVEQHLERTFGLGAVLYAETKHDDLAFALGEADYGSPALQAFCAMSIAGYQDVSSLVGIPGDH